MPVRVDDASGRFGSSQLELLEIVDQPALTSGFWVACCCSGMLSVFRYRMYPLALRSCIRSQRIRSNPVQRSRSRSRFLSSCFILVLPAAVLLCNRAHLCATKRLARPLCAGKGGDTALNTEISRRRPLKLSNKRQLFCSAAVTFDHHAAPGFTRSSGLGTRERNELRIRREEHPWRQKR